MATNKNKNNCPIELDHIYDAIEAGDLVIAGDGRSDLEMLRDKSVETAIESAAKDAEAAKTGPKMVKVRIPRTKKDEEDVFVSVNLRTYLIKRGVEVEVPDFVAEVLRHQEEMLETIMDFETQNQK